MGKLPSKNHNTDIHTKSHIPQKISKSNKLYDFKTDGASANTNKQLIKFENNQFIVRAIMTLIFFIGGMILLSKNIKDIIIFECFGIKLTCMHVGLVIIIVPLFLFLHSKSNIEIKNQK